MNANQEIPSKTHHLHIVDETKFFHDKQKLKKFTNRKPALQNILSKIFHEEEMKNSNVGQQKEDLP